MSTIPDLPVVEEDASMLSTKFGREIANYFSGSPLNRIGFLRADHVFLRSAFSHPSTRFLLLNELAPLVDESQKRLGYVSYAEVKGFTGVDPFEKVEEDMIKNFNSEDEKPLILLLGVDEANRLHAPKTDETFGYKEYSGRPYFAVDISPRGKLAEEANKVIEAVKAKGFSFYQNQRAMGLPYGEGERFGASAFSPPLPPDGVEHVLLTERIIKLPCTPKPDRCLTGIPETHSALSVGPRRYRSMPERSGPVHRRTWQAAVGKNALHVRRGKAFQIFAFPERTRPLSSPSCQQTAPRYC